jgi:prepilin-type N-terminal cleavage/methylation domain-containing protein
MECKVKKQVAGIKCQVSREGLSLIEVSVALVILALIAGGMLGIFSQGFNIGKLSKEKTIAYSLAREKLEESFCYPFPSDSSGTTTRNNIVYNWTLTVSDGPIYPNELKQLAVTVSWGTESYTLVTLKADY